MPRSERYVWDGQSLRLERGDTGGTPYVIDSFVIERGATRGAEQHIARFSKSACLLCDIAPHTLAEFAYASGRLLLSQSTFVRLEADQNGTLHVHLRPPPPVPDAVRLWLGHEDNRGFPQHKGPDLRRCRRLREAALDHGADAGAFIATRSDAVELVEADYAALIGYVDGVLVTSDGTARLPSISEQLLCDAARDHGQTVAGIAITADLLKRHPFWMANARIGVVPIAHLHHEGDQITTPTPVDAQRTRLWRTWLRTHSRPLDADRWAEVAHSAAATMLQSKMSGNGPTNPACPAAGRSLLNHHSGDLT